MKDDAENIGNWTMTKNVRYLKENSSSYMGGFIYISKLIVLSSQAIMSKLNLT